MFEEEREAVKKIDTTLQEPLTVKFRRLTRELLLNEEIQKLLNARVRAELAGDFDGKTPVLTAMIRVAAGNINQAPSVTGNKKEGAGWQGAPLLSIHLEGLTDDQLEKFASQGVRPGKTITVPKQLPEDTED